jgi:hypothetical protein
MRKLFIVSSALLIGCASNFSKPGASEAELARDHAECKQEAPSAVLVGVIISSQHIGQCMERKGWTAKEQKPPS